MTSHSFLLNFLMLFDFCCIFIIFLLLLWALLHDDKGLFFVFWWWCFDGVFFFFSGSCLILKKFEEAWIWSFEAFPIIGWKLLSAKQKLWALKHLVLELGASFWVPNKSFELWSFFFLVLELGASFCVPNKSFELWSILLCNWVQAFECQREPLIFEAFCGAIGCKLLSGKQKLSSFEAFGWCNNLGAIFECQTKALSFEAICGAIIGCKVLSAKEKSQSFFECKKKRELENFSIFCVFSVPIKFVSGSNDVGVGSIQWQSVAALWIDSWVRTKTKMSWKLSVCTRRRELGQG